MCVCVCVCARVCVCVRVCAGGGGQWTGPIIHTGYTRALRTPRHQLTTLGFAPERADGVRVHDMTQLLPRHPRHPPPSHITLKSARFLSAFHGRVSPRAR